MTKPETATGSCLCGEIRFEFSLPTKWCAHCYCPLCRKAHGAGFVTWVGAEEKGLAITSGRKNLTSYRSSSEAERQFCRRCGASMFFKSSKWPGEVHIALACLDSPIDRSPEKNAFIDNKVQWIALQNVEHAED